MNIVIDYNSKVPVYEQVINEIEKLVILNILKPNEQILSIRDLAIQLEINPNTVKKVYDLLEEKGIIITKSTKGTFINENIDKIKEDKINNLLTNIMNIMEELESYGLKKKEILDKLK